MSNHKDGRTLVRIWEDQDGRVHADHDFVGITRIAALKVNLRLDQIKGVVLEGFECDLDARPGDDAAGVPDGN